MFVRSINDLSEATVDELLGRAEQLRTKKAKPDWRGGVIGLVFLEASLRTRTGFAAAAARLGAATVEIFEPRYSPVSMPESLSDTLRTVSGYVDVIVARVPEELRRPSGPEIPLISGGDRGPQQEHPTQALIDIFAIQRLAGPIGEATIALCGDMRMRCVRSLLNLMARKPPRRLLVVSDPSLEGGVVLPDALRAVCERRGITELDDADVLYLAGIPHGAVDEECRTRLRVTTQVIETLKSTAIVLSPLPLIDEIDAESRLDSRAQFFEQSDDGLYVRMAVLDHALSGS